VIGVLLVAAALSAGVAAAESGAPTDGDCGSMGGGPMHGPMRGMMGGCVPSGVVPESLPEPDSSGARLFVRYCAQCHHLPSPATHSAEDWPAVATRMVDRMEQYRISRRGMGRRVIQMPTAEEQQAILAYLQRHALPPARSDALGPPNTPGLSQFKQTCSQCHALPDPHLHTAAEWPGVVDRMRSNMNKMGKPGITDGERDAIVEYLGRHTAR
jgi:mono/diheme cytochrome c family protein